MTNKDALFTQIPLIIYRLYPQLDDFDIETAGFYGYIKSMCQHSSRHSLYGKAWLRQETMAAQTGLSPYKIRQQTAILRSYGLLNVTKSDRIPNKLIYEPLEPLTYEEFHEKYGRGGSSKDERSSDVG